MTVLRQIQQELLLLYCILDDMILPQRIFLDTSVINFIVDHSECIFNGDEISTSINDRTYDDICAMMRIFHYADHNAIEMIISNTTFTEINATADQEKREKLKMYCDDLWNYFHHLIGDDFKSPGIEVKYYEEYLLDKGLGQLSGSNDRKLIIEALFYKCDIFCTRDWKTILKHRKILKSNVPLEILTPTEWCLRYEYIKAY
jgi:hypothetical protein